MSDSGPLTTILILLIVLLVLMILLFFLYKKLNREADGKYTVRNMVYKEGGIRDRVRGVALTVGTHLGVHLWPDGKTEEDGSMQEMQEIQDEEGQVEDGSRQGSDSEGDDQEGDDSTNQGDEMKGKGEDTSDDDDDVTVSESSKQEEGELMDQQKLLGKMEEEKVEKVGESEGKAEASGGAGLLIDLKQFSGSAIWSEEGAGEGTGGDVTAL